VTAAIEAYQAEAVTQRSHLRIPHFQIQRPAMHQQHCRTATLVAKAQACAVDDDEQIRSVCWPCRH